MKNHFYQIIKGKTIFTIHEYMYQVRSNDSMFYNVEELDNKLRCIPSHFQQLRTIHTNDKTVKDCCDIKAKG